MANLLTVNPSVVAAETLSVLSDTLIIGNLIYRDKTPDFGKNAGFAVGDTVNIKQRPDYDVKEFSAGGSVTVQDARESKRNLTVEKHFDITMAIGAKERALNFDGWQEQVIIPAATRLAEKVDTYLGTKLIESAGQYNAAALFGTAADVAAAREAAIRLRIHDRLVLCGLPLETTLLGATWFNQSQTRGSAGEESLRSGQMGSLMGMPFFGSINVPATVRTAGASVASTTNNTGTTNLVGLSVLTFDSLTGQIEIGDRIVIAGVRTPLISTEQVAATGTTCTLLNPIMEIIPDGAAITVVGGGLAMTNKGVICDANAYAVTMPPLDKPEGANASVVSHEGISLRIVSAYNIDTKVQTMSLDMLVGATCWDPRKSLLLTQGS